MLHMVSGGALSQLEVPEWLQSHDWQLVLAGAGSEWVVGRWPWPFFTWTSPQRPLTWLLGFPHNLQGVFQEKAFQEQEDVDCLRPSLKHYLCGHFS